MKYLNITLLIATMLTLQSCLIVMPGTVKDINNYWISGVCEPGKKCPSTPKDCEERVGDRRKQCLEFVENKEETKGTFINH
tara:strand:+ start:647 stop:889 length:243 start_codon:yes stop_codon:yes gene_type:complete